MMNQPFLSHLLSREKAHHLQCLLSVLLIVLFLPGATYSATTNFEVFINNTKISIKDLLRDKDDNVYMNSARYCEALGFKHHRNQERQLLTIRNNGDMLSIVLDFKNPKDTTAYLNGDRHRIHPPVLTFKEFVLIPIEPISDLMGRKLRFEIKEKKPVPKKPIPKKPTLTKLVQEKKSVQEKPAVKEPSPPKPKPLPSKPAAPPVVTAPEKPPSPPAPPAKQPRKRKKFGFKYGVGYYRPDIKEINFGEEWRMFYAPKYMFNDEFGIEVRYDSYSSTRDIVYLAGPGTADIKVKGLSTFFIYKMPSTWLAPNKLTYNIGFGFGLHEFKLRYDSQAVVSTYNRWFKLGTYEVKLGAEYELNRSHALEFEVRSIFTREKISLEEINSQIDAGFSDIYLGLAHIYYFNWPL